MQTRIPFEEYPHLFDDNVCHSKYYLTRAEQDVLDPTGVLRTRFAGLASSQTFRPNPQNPLWCQRTAEAWNSWLTDQVLSRPELEKKFPATWSYETDMMRKCGPQGGSVPFEAITNQLTELYALAHPKLIIRDSVRQAVQLLVRTIRARVRETGFPQLAPYTGYTTEFSGIPWATQKQQWRADSEAEWWSRTGVYYPLPDVLGVRYYRNDVRTIHMDSFANVKVVASSLAARRDWLKQQFPEYFGCWLAPWKFVQPTVTRALQEHKRAYGFDYRKCDRHYSYDLMEATVFPVWRELVPSEFEWDCEATFYKRMFWEPIFMGDHLLVGKHNLFNGSTINNDIETVTDVVIYLAITIEMGHRPQDSALIALGDDVTMLQRPSLRDPRALFREIAEELGHEVSLEKCWESEDFIRVLRRTYESGMTSYDPDRTGTPVLMGAYPLRLTLNSLIHPEWAVGTQLANVVASLQRCDNAYGHPAWYNFVTGAWRIVRNSLHDVTCWGDLETAPIVRDWFDKLYGARWTLGNSPTVAALQKSNTLGLSQD